MPYRLGHFAGVGLDEAFLRLVIDQHTSATLPRLERLWNYYRNALEQGGMAGIGGVGGIGARRGPSARPYCLGQEEGLPSRLVGPRDPATDDRRAARREIVIENDIAWRVQAMVDFMFGKPVTILSTARDEGTRRAIESVLDAVWEASGGIALLQDIALLGHVYGHVDLVLREGERTHAERAQDPAALADAVRIEAIDPTRAIPILDPSDYRRLLAYIIHFERELNEVERWGGGGASRPSWRSLLARAWRTPASRRATSTLTEILSADRTQAYEDESLVADGPNSLTPGVLPVVHIQNISQPLHYEGLGEVEPLIPLQDELNTRLSDRANRVTMQSFRMYLAKGVDGFDQASVEPGAIWTSDNPDASIESFGGDIHSPGEAQHIQEVREALDKLSGVPPLASGVVRAKIGNLSSANALRITLMGVLSKTARKRVTYGRGIARMCELVLRALDHAGLFRTDPIDRGVRLAWPDPLPEDLSEQVAAARAKSELGVPDERVLAELGYAPTDPGVQ